MVKLNNRWDNEEFLEARYGNKCFMPGGMGGGPDSSGPDGGPDASGGGGGGDGGPEVESVDVESSGIGVENAPYGNVGAGVGGYGPEGNPNVGDGPRGLENEPGYNNNNNDNNTGGTGGGHTGGHETTEWENPSDEKYAALLREMWDDYKDRWGPVEEEMSDLLTDDDFGEDVVRKARQAGLAMDNQETYNRMIDRYGADIKGKEAKSLAKSAEMDRLGMGVNLANKTRAGMVDLKDALQKDMIGIGHGVGASAVAGLGQATQMETNRNAAIAQMQQQQQFFNQSMALQQQQWATQYQYAQKQQRSGIFGLIGTAVGGYFGGPVGAMVGGAIGSWIG
ncbi:MAG: hypothetical protein VW683_13950 [Betaproteobacteria bacterium]